MGVIEVVVTGERSRKERRHARRYGEGAERRRDGRMGIGRGETFLSLCNPPDSSQRQLKSEGGERESEREEERERNRGREKSGERRKG